MFNLLYVILAAFGLGLLIFIHELGHYWMARREGMTVEAFSIGFGKPIRVWERDGVKWQICWLPFGGYVRIAGMEKKGALEPYQIPDGFFGKKPWSRIKVALAGPIVNIVFAFVAFTVLWALGGRQKPFSEYTHLIGSVDATSGIYSAGVRPGDEIKTLNGASFHNFQDFIYSAIFTDRPAQIIGVEHDYLQGKQAPFKYQFELPPEPSIADRVRATLGAIQPASYLIYNQAHQAKSILFDPSSPMKGSGIEDGDRILWVDGELMFSVMQLAQTINQPKTLLTIQRQGKTLLVRVPRVKVSDLHLTPQQKAELDDWQNEAKIKGKVGELFFIPYDLNSSCQVEKAISYFNEEKKGTARSSLEIPLLPGDRIVAVDGMPLHSVYDMLQLLQTRHIQIIVQKKEPVKTVSWKEADVAFLAGISWDQMNQMIGSIGAERPLKEMGDLKLLSPVVPKSLNQLSLSEEKKRQLEEQTAAQLERIEQIKDSKQKQLAMQEFEAQQNGMKLGIALSDRPVNYNPSPFTLFSNVLQETWKTLVALFTGTVSPKYMTGPVGIVQVMQQSWGYGFKEALFWLSVVSINLGIINLLPVPVLDGGHICFSLWEWITKKPIKAKTMEKLVIPFVVLLILLFVYLTYNDLMRLFSGFFK